MGNRLLGSGFLLGCVFACSLRAGTPDFVTDVKPVLEAHCVRCHGEARKKGGLSFAHWIEFEEALRRKPTIVVPGSPGESLLVHRLRHADPEERMPQGEDPLKASEIKLIEEWILSGAQWEDDAWRPAPHWSFVGPARPKLPDVDESDWGRNEIDLFVRRRLERHGLSPSLEAERAALVRRLYLDLVGLPPSVEQVDSFLSDTKSDAYERLVDRLLASPAFGEKWARHWLDLARYADSEGYQRDELRNVWPYRDWVIDALNQDLPFDQFTIEQLAGDLLPDPRPEQIVATGFHRNTPVNLEAGTNPEDDYHKQIVDRVNTTGTVWLGLTVACAQCHDHKYDPISSEEYYQLFAFFNRAPVETKQRGEAMGNAGMVYIGPNLKVPMDPAMNRRRQSWLEKRTLAVKGLKELVEPVWTAALEVKQEAELQKRLKIATEKRKLEDYRFVGDQLLKADEAYLRWCAQLDKAASMLLRYPIAETRVMDDQVDRVSFVLNRGDRDRPGKEVSPATPRFLHSFSEQFPRNRLGLAQWLVSKENPLVARVTVNRVWAELFGRGLVESMDDFGKMGEAPSHPELLDWLAETFVVADSWSLKRTIRRMVNSATYRQQTAERSAPLAADPDNRLLWRHPGHRLDAEVIRDNLLTMGGCWPIAWEVCLPILGSRRVFGDLRLGRGP